MRWFEFALRDIGAQRLRYFLTGLTMLLGVLTLAGVTLAGSTVSDALIAGEEQKNGRGVSIATNFTVTADHLPTGLAEEDITGVSQLLQQVRDYTAARGGYVMLSVKSDISVQQSEDIKKRLKRSQRTEMVWLDGELNQLYRAPAAAGSTEFGDLALPPRVVINEHAAAGEQFSVGDIVRINPHRIGSLEPEHTGPAAGIDAKIIGVVADGQTEGRFYGSLATYTELFPNNIVGQSAELRLHMPVVDPHTQQYLIEAMTRNGIVPDSEPRRVDTVDEVAGQLELVQLVFQWVGILLLVVAGLGIANVGLATVGERAHELSVRQALGARPRDIFGQMIGAAVIVGFIVSLITIVLVLVSVYWLLPQLIAQNSAITAPSFPWQACLVGVVAAIGVGVLGGAIPAYSATRVPVAEALRR